MKWIFCIQVNMKLCCKSVLKCLMGVARHAQSAQNNKFAISQQYFKKEVSDVFDFSHDDKHQIFLQVDINIFGGHSQACPKYPK